MSVSEQKETCDQKVSCSWIKSLVFGIFGNEYIYIYIYFKPLCIRGHDADYICSPSSSMCHTASGSRRIETNYCKFAYLATSQVLQHVPLHR